jgi:hypothetical protein
MKSIKKYEKKGNNENKAESIFPMKELTALGVPIHHRN